MTADDLRALADSWMLDLRARRLAPQTLYSYRLGVEQYTAFCDRRGIAPALDKLSVAAFVSDILDSGKSPATAALRQLALRLLSAWLAEEGEIDEDRLANVKPPKMDVPVVPGISDAELEALIAACKGSTFVLRRDEAIVRLMAETGLRAGELLGMSTGDLMLAEGSAIVRRGKGGKGRWIYFGPQTASAIDRYMRQRRRHKNAASDVLWLGDRGLNFTYPALLRTFRVRGAAAGIDHMHPHRLRHTFAIRWLSKGGSETSAMSMAGWTRSNMLARYSAASRSDVARAEAERLGLGDVG